MTADNVFFHRTRVSPSCRLMTGQLEQQQAAAALPGAAAMGSGVARNATAAVTGDLVITVRGGADKPLWDAGSTHQHYTTDEDSSGPLNVKAGLTVRTAPGP